MPDIKTILEAENEEKKLYDEILDKFYKRKDSILRTNKYRRNTKIN